jgi:hypothetical protein
MKIAKSRKWPLILILAVAAAVLFFFIRMYRDDIKALKGFMASYERFDRAVSDLSMGVGLELEGKAGSAAADLASKASLRLSSLIRNDAGLMDQAREVADLAQQELGSLRAYQKGIRQENADVEELAERSRILTEKRKTAYARFREFGGIR